MQKLLFINPIGAPFLGSIADKCREHFDVKIIGKEGSDEGHLASMLYWADGVFFEFCTDYVKTALTKLNYQKKVMIRLHRYELYHPELIMSVYWPKVNKLFLTAQHTYDKFTEWYQVKPKEIKVITSLAIDTNKYGVAERTFEKPYTIGIVGRVIRLKGIYEAIQMIKDLGPDYRLKIIGECQDKEYLQNLRDLREDLNLVNYKDDSKTRVMFTNDLHGQRLVDAYKSLDIILSMSTEECGQFSIGEGMSAGCYPIIRNWRGSKNIWVDNPIGDTYTDILNYVRDWAGRSVEEKKALSLGAREYIKTKYEQDLIENQIVDEIKKTMEA